MLSFAKTARMTVSDFGRMTLARMQTPRLTQWANHQFNRDVIAPSRPSIQNLAVSRRLTPDMFRRRIALELIGSMTGLSKQFSRFDRADINDFRKESLIDSKLKDFIIFANLVGQVETLRIFNWAMDIYHQDTFHHQDRVAWLAGAIGKQRGLAACKINKLQLAGRIHDVGKLAIPERLLNSKALTERGRWIVREGHLQVGYWLLREIDSFKTLAEEMVLYHHVFDGHSTQLDMGNLTEDAFILSAADYHDGATQARAYKKEDDLVRAKDAIEEVRRRAYIAKPQVQGFDPLETVFALERVLREPSVKVRQI